MWLARDLGAGGQALYFDQLGLRAGGSAGGMANAEGEGPLLGSVTLDLRLDGAIADQGWRLDTGIALGLGIPAPTEDWLDVPHSPSQLRGHLRIGTGW